MKKDEFLKMMVQDNDTESEPNKSIFVDVIECMDIALSQSADFYEVSPDKNIKEAYSLIEKRYREKGGGKACVGPFEAAEILAEYLGTSYERPSKRFATKKPKVNLDSFFD